MMNKQNKTVEASAYELAIRWNTTAVTIYAWSSRDTDPLPSLSRPSFMGKRKVFNLTQAERWLKRHKPDAYAALLERKAQE